MNKLALSILFAPFGLIWGIIMGSWAMSLFAGEPVPQNHMGTAAIVIGAPAGAAMFAYLGYRLGSLLDRRAENVPHRNARRKTDLRTLAIFILAGVVVGVITFFAADRRGSPTVYVLAFGFSGCLIGYIRHVFLAMVRRPANTDVDEPTDEREPE